MQGGLRAAAGAERYHLKAPRRMGWGAVRPQDGRGRCRIAAHSGLPRVLGRWGNTPGQAGSGSEGRGYRGRGYRGGATGRGPTHRSLGLWGCGMLSLYEEQNGAYPDRAHASRGPFGTE